MVYFCHSENSCMNCIVKNQILLRIGMGWMIVTQNVIQIIRSHQKTQNYTYVKNDIDKGKKGSNSSCRPTCWHILFRKTVANRGRTTTTMSKHSTMLKEEELKPVQMENREETTHNNAGAESLRLRDRDSSRSRQGSENWKASCANEWSKKTGEYRGKMILWLQDRLQSRVQTQTQPREPVSRISSVEIPWLHKITILLVPDHMSDSARNYNLNCNLDNKLLHSLAGNSSTGKVRYL